MSNVIKFKTSPVDLLSLHEIEKKYKIKYITAYKHVVLEHKIPYFRFGRNIRVSEEDFVKLFSYQGV